MCIICVDLAKRTLTTSEARRALGEMRGALDKQHVSEVETLVQQLEAEHDAPTKP
jgi:hypothetical protein